MSGADSRVCSTLRCCAACTATQQNASSAAVGQDLGECVYFIKEREGLMDVKPQPLGNLRLSEGQNLFRTDQSS